jgi:hypothetical protein
MHGREKLWTIVNSEQYGLPESHCQSDRMCGEVLVYGMSFQIGTRLIKIILVTIQH